LHYVSFPLIVFTRRLLTCILSPFVFSILFSVNFKVVEATNGEGGLTRAYTLSCQEYSCHFPGNKSPVAVAFSYPSYHDIYLLNQVCNFLVSLSDGFLYYYARTNWMDSFLPGMSGGGVTAFLVWDLQLISNSLFVYEDLW